jgi:uncharacterized protein involved in exopolysaccharide biosynthesis
MTNPITQTELAEVLGEIRQGFKAVNDSLNQLEKSQAEMKTELKGIDKRLTNVESSVQKIPDLSEKVGELKNWKQIGVIVITALISSIFTGTIGGFIGYSIRSLKP